MTIPGVGSVTPGSALDAAVGVGIGVAAVMGARVPASLRCTTGPSIGFVPFDFNPEKITMSRRSRVGAFGNPVPPTPNPTPNTSGGSFNPTTALHGSTISLGKVVFAGPLTKFFCDQLLAWMIPNASFGALAGGLGLGKFASQPAQLTFQWGPPMAGFMYKCKLSNCSVEYVRFSAIGIPLRANVTIELIELPTLWGSLPTNPTSGGLPGRRSHVVAHGETLHSIATDRYGTPALWRRIAEVNRITDPTRVRPGTTIYLPNPDELTAGSAA